MNTFNVVLRDTVHSEQLESVRSFVGEDASGSFGIMAGHDRMMTSLVFGLARFRIGTEDWQYLAMPGGVLYFVNNRLTISTRRYFRDYDFERISATLHKELFEEERALMTMKRSLRRMEEEMLRRLRELGKDRAQIL